MACMLKSHELSVSPFAHKQTQQKMWLNALLQYTLADIDHLAEILDIASAVLLALYENRQVLENKDAEKLNMLFCITFQIDYQ